MIFHTSHTKELAKKWDSKRGNFGSALFFSPHFYSMGGNECYRIDEEKLNLCERFHIETSDNDLTEVVEFNWVLEHSDVFWQELYCKKYSSICDILEDVDKLQRDGNGWESQALLCFAAVVMGYDGIKDEDEQGGVYIIDGDKIMNKIEYLGDYRELNHSECHN